MRWSFLGIRKNTEGETLIRGFAGICGRNCGDKKSGAGDLSGDAREILENEGLLI